MLYLAHIDRVLHQDHLLLVEQIDGWNGVYIVELLAVDERPFVVAINPLGREVCTVFSPFVELFVGVDGNNFQSTTLHHLRDDGRFSHRLGYISAEGASWVVEIDYREVAL